MEINFFSLINTLLISIVFSVFIVIVSSRISSELFAIDGLEVGRPCQC